MKTIHILFAASLILVLSSFKTVDSNSFIGTYGVTASNPSQIQLILNTDHSFYYQDFSVSSNKIKVKGNWILKGKKVHLNNTSTEVKFHDTWTFDAQGQFARSRKGMAFYRLCRIDN